MPILSVLKYEATLFRLIIKFAVRRFPQQSCEDKWSLPIKNIS